MSLSPSLRPLAAAAVLAAAALTAPLAAQADDPVKVGFVYVGPIGDHGWSYQHNEGRLAVEEAFGDGVETAFVESVKEGADAERVIRQFAANGFDLIFTTSFGFMNPTVKVAEQFPDVKFEHATGYKRTDNVSTYMGRFYEGRYVAGKIAGRMTESNVVGYVGSFPIPEVVRGINSFTQGMRSVNPEAEMKVIWVNSWYDPGKEREATETLIAQGADIITQHTDSPAPVQVAAEKGVFAFGQASDMVRFGPDAHLTAIIDDWNGYYVARTKAVMDGTWETSDTWGGFDTGMVVMSQYNAILPAEVIAEAEATVAGVADGSMHPFAGPIMNQAGEVVVPEGERMTDEQLLSMDWYVQGVQGSLPN